MLPPAEPLDFLREALVLALSALPDSMTAGPEGTGYVWAWHELTGVERDWVKDIRRRVAMLESEAWCHDATRAEAPR